jgi:RND family efflux transporter MFP subunit
LIPRPASTVARRLGARRRGWVIAAILLGVAAALFLAGYLPRRNARTKLAADAAAAQRTSPRVAVVRAMAMPAQRTLTLPGSLVADQQTLVYARVSGYVRRWLVDIGDHVQAGDLQAELDIPDLVQQLAQARATLELKRKALAQAVASRDYARVTATRVHTLAAQNLLSRQDDDQAHAQALVWDANVGAARADVQATEANVRQLEQLVSYGRVVAPFDGTITQRNVDVGTLVNAGAGSVPQALFALAATDPMRVFVQVPQTFAPSVHAGQDAAVAVRQYPGRVFEGRVTRTAGALDPVSRTLNTEIQVPNGSGELFAGMYAQVTVAVALSHAAVRVPSSAVIEDARGVHVATVDGAGQVHLVAVQPGPDTGSQTDVVAGLSGGEQVIVSPGGDVTDGTHVEAVPSAQVGSGEGATSRNE